MDDKAGRTAKYVSAIESSNNTRKSEKIVNIYFIGPSGVGKSYSVNCMNDKTDSNGRIIPVTASGDSSNGLTDKVSCVLSKKMHDGQLVNIWDSGGNPDTVTDGVTNRTPLFTDMLIEQMRQVPPDLLCIHIPYPSRIGYIDNEGVYRGFLSVFAAVLSSFPACRIKIVLTKAKDPEDLDPHHEMLIRKKFEDYFGPGISIWYSFFGAYRVPAYRKQMIQNLQEAVWEIEEFPPVNCSGLKSYSEVKSELQIACRDIEAHLNNVRVTVASMNAQIADIAAHMERLKQADMATCWIPIANIATMAAFAVEIDKARVALCKQNSRLGEMKLVQIDAEAAAHEARRKCTRLVEVFNDPESNI